MNQYKIEMKEIFRKEILVCAESEKEATDIVEKAYLRTNMLDHSYKDLAAVETKIIGKREENNYDEMEEFTAIWPAITRYVLRCVLHTDSAIFFIKAD